MPDIKLTKSTSERYTIRIPGSWWADITLSLDGFLNIQSDYGSYSYAWGSFGDNFKKFLLDCDIHYIGKKIGGSLPRELNLKESIKQIRREIIDQRRVYKNWSADSCREFWNATEELEEESYNTTDAWYHAVMDSYLARLYEEDPSSIPCSTELNYSLQSFMKIIWPEFMKILAGEEKAGR